MKLFPYGHATHPHWQVASGLVLAQLRGCMVQPGYASAPTLALLYITDAYAPHAQDILDYLSAELPEVTDWSGTVGVGIASNNVEYFDEPALAVMLCELPHDHYRVFSGVAPLPQGSAATFKAHTALVDELAQRTQSGYVFGGLAASRTRTVQFALSGHGNIKGHGGAGGVFSGGLSGVAFARDPLGGMGLMSRVTQGCSPISPTYAITACDGNVVTELDGQPALDVMLAELGVSLEQPRQALARVRSTLVGLSPSQDLPGDATRRRAGQFGADVRVRQLVGLDPVRKGVAIAETPSVGMRLAFCERNAEAARMDLIRICAEIREELEPEELTLEVAGALRAAQAQWAPTAGRYIAGAVYVSCAGRGGPHFGAPSAELQIVRRALGDVPLVGFFASGEIARNHLYGYTGVLTVFAAVD